MWILLQCTTSRKTVYLESTAMYICDFCMLRKFSYGKDNSTVVQIICRVSHVAMFQVDPRVLIAL
jgi:hypothetical protein